MQGELSLSPSKGTRLDRQRNILNRLERAEAEGRPGAAQPGEYVTIVYSGPMQVKVAPGESAIAAGTRLTAAVDGSVRPLLTRAFEGMVVAEGAPVIGVALEAAGDGLIWVLVNPQ